MLTQRKKCYNITIVRKFLLREELNGLVWSSYCDLGDVCAGCAGDTGRGYVLTSIAHMKALKALGYDNAWMAWIPFAQQYALADVAAGNQETVMLLDHFLFRQCCISSGGCCGLSSCLFQ